ncbi:ATP synthase F1 subunit gamma [Zongyangia hominis]|uniref:ATP synthase gamma chain n=1 Tax=Zongyangia hominis TaxID=2763677 RepID=A0A926IB61_9FIRM|nr:ATP synthase F1 subunit gamma [Zongyangia hominis]MBC8569837.1 ATP synthase F1 subunit gamma [Zongyangia hominis]
MAGAGMKDIKRRMKSIEGTMQITKAMELVASSKLKRARERMEQAKPFFHILYDTMARMATGTRDFESAYVRPRPVKSSCYVIIGGDRGLAGGYNTNLLRVANAHMEGKDVKVLPIGRKVADYYAHRKVELVPYEKTAAEDIHLSDSFAIGRLLAKMYDRREIDEVFVIYTNFVTVLTHEPAVLKALPLHFEVGSDAKNGVGTVVYEPSVSGAFDMIIPQYLGGIVYGGVCESFACEQGARRMAMETANDNAQQMLDDLGLRYNRARQGAITQELTEIVAGAEALK